MSNTVEKASSDTDLVSRRSFIGLAAVLGVAAAVRPARAGAGGQPNDNAAPAGQNAHGANPRSNDRADNGDPQPDRGADSDDGHGSGPGPAPAP